MEPIAEKKVKHKVVREVGPGKPKSLLDLTEAALRSLTLVHAEGEATGGAGGVGQEKGGEADAVQVVPRDRRERKKRDAGKEGGEGEEEEEEAGGEGGTLTCKTAPGVVFTSRAELAEHCRGDWHRFNLKMASLGRPMVNEDEFEAMVDDLSSLSGSESESEVDEDELALDEVLRAQHANLAGHAHDDDDDQEGGTSRRVNTPFVRVEGPELPRFRIYAAVLPQGAAKGDGAVSPSDVTKSLTSLAKCKVTLLFASGGHFAGCVYQGGQQIRHKTFHRYVIRAKAGTRQLTRDAMGGSSVPKSAGSSIRRHNEEALQRDINELLESWRGDIQDSCLVFVHAPGTINRASLFGSGIISGKDPRVRSVPFPTRRPTLSEVARVHAMLLAMHEDVADEHVPAAKPEKKMKKPVQVESSDDEEEAAKEDPMFGWCAKGNMPEAKRHVASGGNVDPPNSIGRTPLHLAALNGPARIIGFLLDLGADPTIKDDAGKVPYALSRGKEERDAFRRYMGEHPERWDYNAAAVPSALTSEMEEEQERRAAEKKEKEKARRKEQERKKKEAERKKKEEAEAKAAVTKATATMTERERRALAAEKRLGVTPTLSPTFVCENCKKPSCGSSPFERLGFKYCSTACVVEHKKVLGK